jgi:hypothetical protein
VVRNEVFDEVSPVFAVESNVVGGLLVGFMAYKPFAHFGVFGFGMFEGWD